MSYTRGPLEVSHLSSTSIVATYNPVDMVCGVSTRRYDPDVHGGHIPREEFEANARLLAASFTSYDKHCGEQAVACAEGDLLGEALEAIRAILEMPIYSSTPSQQRRVDAHREQLKAVLAKAKGENP